MTWKRLSLLIAITLLACSPALAWAFYKPSRVLAPQWVDGISCTPGNPQLKAAPRSLLPLGEGGPKGRMRGETARVREGYRRLHRHGGLSPRVCTDDPDRFDDAVRLYEDALRFVDATAGPIETPPRIVFCATQACFRAFGFERAAARAIGTSGIVVGPRGWQPHYLRHELIHHLQAERLGLRAMLFGPEWFIEGMAYALSDDPRPMLGEPWQGHRERFESWYREIDRDRL